LAFVDKATLTQGRAKPGGTAGEGLQAKADGHKFEVRSATAAIAADLRCDGGEMGSTETRGPWSHAGVLLARKTNSLRNLPADNNGYALAA
jgi:hypothetical protein